MTSGKFYPTDNCLRDNKLHQMILDTAKNAAIIGAEYVRNKFNDLANIQIESKAQNDFVTNVDRESEKLIIEEIRKEFPTHNFLGEEYGEQSGTAGYTWIIDPLDGTKNFIQGIPVFAVSIGVLFEDRIIAGAIADVMNGNLYFAESGQGAYKNNNRIHVSDQPTLKDSFFSTGFPFRHKDVIPDFCRTMDTLLKLSSGGRRIGAAALDLCWIAQGSFDFFFEFGLSPWDVAAGSIILSEAGGTISDFNGESNYLFGKRIIASNGKFHQELLALIPSFFIAHGDQAG